MTLNTTISVASLTWCGHIIGINGEHIPSSQGDSQCCNYKLTYVGSQYTAIYIIYTGLTMFRRDILHIQGFHILFYTFFTIKEKIKIYTYLTLMIKMQQRYLHPRAPNYVFEPKFSIMSRHSHDQEECLTGKLIVDKVIYSLK